MKERSLVAFTLLAQTAVGMFWGLAGVAWTFGGAEGGAPLLAVGPLLAAAALVSLLHLGSPRNAWRALGNLKSSWLSREILFLALFSGGWAAVVVRMSHALTAVVAAFGVGLIYSMARVYRLRTVPAWDTPLTPAAFFLTAGSLGGLAAALAVTLSTGTGEVTRALALLAGWCVAVEICLEPAWRARRLAAAERVDRGLDPRRTVVGKPGLVRPGLLILALTFTLAASLSAGHGALIAAALAAALAAAVAGRRAFYGSYARLGV